MEMCLTGCIWVNALHTITYDDLGEDTQNTIIYELPKKRKKPLKMPISWYFQEFVNYFHPEVYCPICFANFPSSPSRPHIPGTMYFTGFAVIFDCSESIPFLLNPPNFILGENSFCFLKFPISDFSNLGDNYFPFGGIWG